MERHKFRSSINDVTNFPGIEKFELSSSQYHDHEVGGGEVAEDELEEFFLALACVRMCDLRLVDWANFLSQLLNGQT